LNTTLCQIAACRFLLIKTNSATPYATRARLLTT
jgi:hypothetical protein